jgi:DNA-binding CsgD family transcriptional regulator/PAS domain-containing protein
LALRVETLVAISAKRLSDLIGAIYDCAIDPGRWPATMELICRETGFVASTILVADLRSGAQRHVAEWNTSPHFQELISHKLAPYTAELFKLGLSMRASIDEPMILSRLGIDRAAYRQSPMYLEWAKPQGYGDTINLTVLDDPPHRIGTLSLAQREIDGDVTDAQIAMMRLLAPHVRRAVTISDLIELKALETLALSETLDGFSVGVVLTNADAKILHANSAAHDMIRRQSPIMARRGRLAAPEARGSSQLSRAIDLAASDETNIGAEGIGIPLRHDGDAHAAAYVLPLVSGKIRPNLMPSARAAVFVTPSGSHVQRGVAAAAQAFGLTEAETKLLSHLADGLTVANTAAELGVSETTARTHLAHIFSKCGVTRQPELIRLVFSLAAPVREK